MSRSILLAGITAFASLACRASVEIGPEPKLTLSVHEPVIAEFVLKNTGSTVAQVDTGQAGEASYRITVTLPDGEMVNPEGPLWTRASPDVVAGIHRTEIAPGQSAILRVLLSEWYAFDKVGSYEVSVSVPGVQGAGYVQIDVSARDQSRLRSLCERLSRDASDLESPERFSATRALSFVSDDVAIPFMEKLASGKFAESPMVIDGLARIGDLSAVSALGSIAEHGDAPEVRSHSRFGLIMLRESTSDRNVRIAIDAILARANTR